MTTFGILGAGQAGSALARVLVAAGYDVLVASSRSPSTVADLARSLGPRARPAWAADAAAEADVAVLAFPYRPEHTLPAAELAGKVVIDNNNYFPARDGRLPAVLSGQVTVHELRQDQLPGSALVKAFSHIQFHGKVPARDPGDELPALVRLARPRGAPDRIALVASSDDPDAARLVAGLYDELGFDAVDSSPLSESWRSAPGTPAWAHSFDGQTQVELSGNLRLAMRPRG